MIEQFVLDDIFHTEFFLLNISEKKITVLKHFWAEFEQAGVRNSPSQCSPIPNLEMFKNK